MTDHPSAFWDFLPTACELAGISPPKDIDGISYLPTLLGKEQPAHEYLYWKMRGKAAVRQGNWKAVRPGEGKPLELYDLDTDMGESRNIAQEHPERVQQMQEIVARYDGQNDADGR